MKCQELRFALQGTFVHAPVRGALEIIDDALIGIDDAGAIVGLARRGEAGYNELEAALEAAGKLERFTRGKYLLPGLVDAHIHAPQWPQLGKALDRPLDIWLQKYTYPLEARYADPQFAERVYTSLVDTLIANGTTTALYFGTVHLEASKILADICLRKGQRALVGKITMDDPEQCPEYYRDRSARDGLDGTVALIDHIRGRTDNAHGLVSPVVMPRFIPSCTDQLLHGLGEIARETRAHVHTHCSEGDWEHAFVRARCGRTDTMSLDHYGLLTEQAVLAHCNYIDDRDMEMIGERGVGISHCPLANLYFSNAVFPARRALDRGLDVGLGTDVSGGASPSILHACQMAVTASRALEDGVNPQLSRERRGTPGTRIDFREAFWMATSGGGLALDLKVGLFAPGYAFDAIVIDTSIPDSNLIIWEGIDEGDDLVQKMIYNADRRNITRVWVQGRRVRG
jgi:guanine deaminase